MTSIFEKTKIEQLYISGMSLPEVSQFIGKSMSTIRLHLKEKGLLRSRKEGVRNAAAKGKLSHMKGKTRSSTPEWNKNISKGRLRWADKHAKGTYINGNGYEEYTRGEHKGRGVHVILMETRIGRKLLPDECVHHIDGNRANNDDNNLALLTRSGHMRLHRFEEIWAGKTRERKESGRFC